MFKIDKTLVDNMNVNKSCIVITHKETVRMKAPAAERMTLDGDKELPPEVLKQAQEFVQKANEQARQITAQAHQQAEDIKEAARQEGLDEGLSQAARAQEEQLYGYKTRMESALEQMEAYRQKLFEEMEAHVLELSLDIAEKIINTKLNKDDSVYKELVNKAVGSLNKAKGFTLTVSQDMYEKLFKDGGHWLEAETGCGEVKVAVDRGMAPVGCVAESDSQLVDTGVTTQLKNIRQYLGEQVG